MVFPSHPAPCPSVRNASARQTPPTCFASTSRTYGNGLSISGGVNCAPVDLGRVLGVLAESVATATAAPVPGAVSTAAAPAPVGVSADMFCDAAMALMRFCRFFARFSHTSTGTVAGLGEATSRGCIPCWRLDSLARGDGCSFGRTLLVGRAADSSTSDTVSGNELKLPEVLWRVFEAYFF